MMVLVTVLAPGGKPLHKRLGFLLGRLARHPITEVRASVPWRATERGVITLVMQSADNSLTVNPALTITARAERAFPLWPARGEPDGRPAPGEPYDELVLEEPPRVTTRT